MFLEHVDQRYMVIPYSPPLRAALDLAAALCLFIQPALPLLTPPVSAHRRRRRRCGAHSSGRSSTPPPPARSATALWSASCRGHGAARLVLAATDASSCLAGWHDCGVRSSVSGDIVHERVLRIRDAKIP